MKAWRGGGALVNSLLVIAAAVTAFPLLWMVSVSFMAPGEASNFPPPLFPAKPTLEAYRQLFAGHHLGRNFLNSLFLATAATLISLVCNTSAGYAFAKLRFAGRDRLFQILLMALIVPGQVGMMPLFLMLKSVGLVNSYAGALVPWIAQVSGIYLVRQYARSLPDEMLDAARVDGAGELTIFVRIVLPLLGPILATLAIFTFLANWNDFIWPLVILTDSSRYTLPVAIASLSREHVQDSELMMAGAVVTILPVLVIFLALQRYYIRGLAAGSVKG